MPTALQPHTLVSVWVLCLLVSAASGSSVLVSVQAQDKQHMDDLTQKIDRAAYHGSARFVLGAIEATMSRVVDMDDPYVLTKIPSIPTMALLENIAYDEARNQWRLRYRSMQFDPDSSVNSYKRLLYLSLPASLAQNDVNNPCLDRAVDMAACLPLLRSTYILSDQAVAGEDSLALDDLRLSGDRTITVSLSQEFNSMMQVIELIIPHASIYEVLGKRTVTNHPLRGEQVQWSLGIGMLFFGATSNVVMFDEFRLIEESNQLVSFAKTNSYSIAKHVSFWTSRIASRPDVYVATLEYTLDAGHELSSIEVTVNQQDVSLQCADMQARINALNDSSCVSRYPLCHPVTYAAQDGSQMLWVTMVVPVFGVQDGEEVTLNTLLVTNNTLHNPERPQLSSLSFSTRQAPQAICEDIVLESFDPISYTHATLYRGTAITAETVLSNFAVENVSESVSMAESLMTLVIAPRDDPSATQYFERFTDEEILLDNVYMSHSLFASTLPSSLQNNIYSVSEGRSQITLDPRLQEACPEEKPGSVFAWQPGFGFNPHKQCVTTHDWTVAGEALRPFSSTAAGPYFVHAVDAQAAAVNWLTSNVVGTSAHGVAMAEQIYANAVAKVPAGMAAHAKVYWIWPLYYWPDRSPLGLKDRTIISLSWSLTRQASSPQRRLLGIRRMAKPYADIPRHPVRKARLPEKMRISTIRHPKNAQKKQSRKSADITAAKVEPR